MLLLLSVPSLILTQMVSTALSKSLYGILNKNDYFEYTMHLSIASFPSLIRLQSCQLSHHIFDFLYSEFKLICFIFYTLNIYFMRLILWDSGGSFIFCFVLRGFISATVLISTQHIFICSFESTSTFQYTFNPKSHFKMVYIFSLKVFVYWKKY